MKLSEKPKKLLPLIAAFFIFLLITADMVSAGTLCQPGLQHAFADASVLTAAGSSAESVPTATMHNSIAFFLAGMLTSFPPPWDRAASTDAWKKFAARMDAQWARFSATRARSIEQWRRTELAAVPSTATIFYPFSGPDFLYLHTLFPDAQRSILIGLEPTGTLPTASDLSPNNIEHCLSLIEASLEDILRISFFKTNDMSQELGKGCVTGTLPLLMIFLARTHHHIERIEFFDLTDNGTVLPRPLTAQGSRGSGKCRGIEIECTSAEGMQKKLIYLSANLSDSGLTRCPGCAAYCEAIEQPVVTFLKSASYLMHKAYFSRIRNLILQKSSVIVQDDSGIPFRFFKSDQWNVTLYGVYERPIELFKNHFEPDLAAAYRRGAVPLPFRFGYTTHSNLLRAIKKNGFSMP